MKVTLRFAWYDLWVGAYVDTAKRTVYICPLPCVLITIQRKPPRPLSVRHHTYRAHLYVPGVCTCGWPPEDPRHCSCDPGSYMGLHGLTCPLRLPDSEGFPAAGTSAYPPSAPNGENAGSTQGGELST